MLALVLAHFLAAVAAPPLVRVLGRRALLALALVPAVAAGWAVTQASAVADGEVRTQVVRWVPSLHLDLAGTATDDIGVSSLSVGVRFALKPTW